MYPSGQKHFFHLTTVCDAHILITTYCTGCRLCECVPLCVPLCVCACGQTPTRANPSQPEPSLAQPNQAGDPNLVQEIKSGNKHQSIGDIQLFMHCTSTLLSVYFVQLEHYEYTNTKPPSRLQVISSKLHYN